MHILQGDSQQSHQVSHTSSCSHASAEVQAFFQAYLGAEHHREQMLIMKSFWQQKYNALTNLKKRIHSL